MAKATFVKKAQKNIYERGKEVEYVSEKGKKKGQTLTKTDRTIPADKKDKIFIAKGESYYWWAFQYRPKQYSKTQPKRSQLTQSGFLSTLYDLQDRISDFTAESVEDIISFKDEIASEVESLKDEAQSSLDNMPEHLQESSSSGETLRERVDELENWQSELEGLDFEEVDESEVRSEIEEENEKEVFEGGEEAEEEGADETDDEYKERIDGLVKDAIQEKVDEAISLLQDCQCNL